MKDERRNKPTPEGRQLGEQLARLTEIAIKDCRKTLPDEPLPERCRSCAFRAGTFPNGCPETVLDAISCVQDGTTFFCHHKKKGEPLHACAGWFVSQISPAMKHARTEKPLVPDGFVPPFRMTKEQDDAIAANVEKESSHA